KFIPATGNGNTATIEFTPAFDAEDDDYELFVTGKDAVGNEAGKTGYHVTFRVIGKPMILKPSELPQSIHHLHSFCFHNHRI
ncbi:MAG TPA: hypothetical protein PLM81_13900, partial [Ginsengibacter sp.]|nr:hypothetical protein [Ginsengibacter sp.]